MTVGICALAWQVGQNLSDPFDMEFPSLAEASEVQWVSLKDRWGPPPRPFVVAQGMKYAHNSRNTFTLQHLCNATHAGFFLLEPSVLRDDAYARHASHVCEAGRLHRSCCEAAHSREYGA